MKANVISTLGIALLLASPFSCVVDSTSAQVSDIVELDEDEGPAGYCCVSECAQCAAPESSKPFPSGDPSDFICPVAEMADYYILPDHCYHFDCDDFAFACKMWSDANGYNTCQLSYKWKEGGKWKGHAINIVEFAYPDSDVLQKYCLIEPQSNNSYGCWIQQAGKPKPSASAMDKACRGGTHCTIKKIWCDPAHSPSAGERCFTSSKNACNRFENVTGISTTTWKAIPE